MQLRFMQRASSKARDQEDTVMHANNEKPQQPNDEHWVIDGAKDNTGCVVVIEGDPTIQSSFGRRSFSKSFGSGTVQLQQAAKMPQQDRGVAAAQDDVSTKKRDR